jgi:glycerol-3-phosphate dehydrogenase
VISTERALVLLQRYGTYATRIIKDLAELGDVPLGNHADYSRGEIASLIRNEWVVTLSDVVHRRTSLAFSGQISSALLQEIADIMAPLMGWSDAEVARQVESITVEEGSSQWILS